MNKCPTCGSEVRPGDNFCLTCGNRLPSASSPQQSSTLTSDATIPAQDWSTPSAPPPVYGGWSGNDRTLAGSGGSASELPTVRAESDEDDQATVRAEPDEAESPTVRANTSLYGSNIIEKPARFVIRSPNGDILQDYVLDKPKVVIGRVPESDINFPEDKLVSRLHATVRYEDGHYTLRDEGSANGTLVNNQPLERSTDRTLQDGDQILIGDHELTFKGVTPPPPGIEESETIIMPLGSVPEAGAPVDDEKTMIGNDPLGTRTMDVANLPFARSASSPEPPVQSSVEAPVSQAASPEPPTPVGTPEPSLSAKPVPPADVTVRSFSGLSQPAVPGVDALLAASTALNEQITSLQQQLQTTQEAMRNHDTEVAQTADRLRTAMRRLADRMDSTISNVARSRDEMDWNGLQNALQDVLGSPRDIGYAMEFARRASDVDKVIQRYQGVLNTLAECNSLLRGLIGEEKP